MNIPSFLKPFPYFGSFWFFTVTNDAGVNLLENIFVSICAGKSCVVESWKWNFGGDSKFRLPLTGYHLPISSESHGPWVLCVLCLRGQLAHVWKVPEDQNDVLFCFFKDYVPLK